MEGREWGDGWFTVSANSGTSCLSLQMPFPLIKKGETFHTELTQKRARTLIITLAQGQASRERLRESLWAALLKKMHLKYVIKAEGWWKVFGSISKRPSQCVGFKSLKRYLLRRKRKLFLVFLTTVVLSCINRTYSEKKGSFKKAAIFKSFKKDIFLNCRLFDTKRF